jgi:hypothetical protein
MKTSAPDPDRDSMFTVVYAVALCVLAFLFALWLVTPAHAVEASFYMTAERFTMSSTPNPEKLAYTAGVMNTLQIAGRLTCPRDFPRGEVMARAEALIWRAEGEQPGTSRRMSASGPIIGALGELGCRWTPPPSVEPESQKVPL